MQMERLLNQRLSSYFTCYSDTTLKIMTIGFDQVSPQGSRDFQEIR